MKHNLKLQRLSKLKIKKSVTASLYFCASSHSNVQRADYTTNRKRTAGTLLRSQHTHERCLADLKSIYLVLTIFVFNI